MLTRSQARKQSITPIVGKKVPSKTSKRVAILKKVTPKKTSNTKKDIGDDNIHVDISDIVYQVVPPKKSQVIPATWQPFLRKLYDSEPTNDQYEVAWKNWQHILTHVNAMVIFGSDTILMRDFRGGTLSLSELNTISTMDPGHVYIRAAYPDVGVFDHAVAIYLKDDYKSAMQSFQMMGWSGRLYDPNEY